jgi:predicted HTH transcriptional regulator
MKCAVCGKEIPADEVHEYKGKTLCEDDYIEAISPEKHCDPWATYLASRESGATGVASLSDLQKEIAKFLKEKRKGTRQEVMDKFKLSASDLEEHLRVLMHSENVQELTEAGESYLKPIK